MRRVRDTGLDELLINDDLWQKMTPETQKIVKDTWKEVATETSNKLADDEKKTLDEWASKQIDNPFLRFGGEDGPSSVDPTVCRPFLGLRQEGPIVGFRALGGHDTF